MIIRPTLHAGERGDTFEKTPEGALIMAAVHGFQRYTVSTEVESKPRDLVGSFFFQKKKERDEHIICSVGILCLLYCATTLAPNPLPRGHRP
jgi:hypothetical protein